MARIGRTVSTKKKKKKLVIPKVLPSDLLEQGFELTDQAKAVIDVQAQAEVASKFVTYKEYYADVTRYVSKLGFRGGAPNFIEEVQEAYKNFVHPEIFGKAYVEKYGKGTGSGNKD